VKDAIAHKDAEAPRLSEATDAVNIPVCDAWLTATFPDKEHCHCLLPVLISDLAEDRMPS